MILILHREIQPKEQEFLSTGKKIKYFFFINACRNSLFSFSDSHTNLLILFFADRAHGKSAPTTPETERKTSIVAQPKVRHYSVATPQFKSPSR